MRQAQACRVLALGVVIIDLLVVITGATALYETDCARGGGSSGIAQSICKGEGSNTSCAHAAHPMRMRRTLLGGWPWFC